jgi:hypothetical protein
MSEQATSTSLRPEYKTQVKNLVEVQNLVKYFSVRVVDGSLGAGGYVT